MTTNPDPRHYLMHDQTMTEMVPATCPQGHDRKAGGTGWQPCRCTDGHTGHRMWTCPQCDAVAVWPGCKRQAGWKVWWGVPDKREGQVPSSGGNPGLTSPSPQGGS